MKAFGVLIILTAIGLFGTAFFGVYTAPGLEEFPTLKSLTDKKESKSSPSAKKVPQERPKGIFPANPNGAASQRGSYLRKSQDKVAPGG